MRSAKHFVGFLVGRVKEVFLLDEVKTKCAKHQGGSLFIYNNFYILGAGGRGF
jgi:hypothetical protein